MIRTKQFFGFRNVISKIFTNSTDSLADHMTEMYGKISEAGLTLTPHYIFSIVNNVQEDLPVYEVSVPVQEETVHLNDPEMTFRSYYFQKDLLSVRVLNDFGQQSLAVYSDLIQYAYNNKQEIVTPFFNVMTMHDDGTPWYMDVNCRVAGDSDDELLSEMLDLYQWAQSGQKWNGNVF
jgi:hypothetical protein